MALMLGALMSGRFTHSRISRSYHVENWTAALRQLAND